MQKTVLSAASCYNEKYYFNELFNRLPGEIKDEIKILTVLNANKLGGIFVIGFYEDGSLYFESKAEETDYNYDEILAPFEIERIKKEKSELIRQLQLYYITVLKV